MTRRSLITSLAVGSTLPAQAAARPNIILILADDLGYGDLGCYGQRQIATPNIDRLAAEGTRFRQGYAGSTVCAPSRCCLMTGFHTGHARTRGNRSPDLPLRPQDVTFTELLKKAGYRTALFGKWSLGGLGTTGYPLRKGFDEWMGFFSQVHAHNYYPEHLLDGERELLLRGNMGRRQRDYAHDLFTERGLRFLEKTTQPFFLHLCYTVPHANNELGSETGNGMEVPEDAPYSGRAWPQVEKNFAAMLHRLDRDVGRVLDWLRASGKDNNTLVLFSSDNGPHREGGHDPDFFQSRGPLRGIKRDLYEGGIRVPLLARWPGRVPVRTSEEVWAFWDMMPTLAELAGVKPPAGIDGISFAPTLLGRPQPRRHEYLYWEFHEGGFAQAVRMGEWKAVRVKRGAPLEIYHLASDPGEVTNVAAAQPAIVKRAEEYLRAARTESPEFPVKD